MTATTPARHDLWRWYILLFIANELDLAFTYLGLSGGTFLEANPMMRPLLYTFWPIAMKLVPMAGLALGLAIVVRTGHARQVRALGAVRLATAIYTVILVLHVLNVLRTIIGRS